MLQTACRSMARSLQTCRQQDADRILASRMGAMAIQAIMEGQRNVMIGIQNNELVYVPFSRAVRHNKSINRDYVNLVKILSM